MNPVDIVIVAVVAVIVGLSIWYIYRSKKSGKKCIGCPDGGNCAGGCCGSCNCGCDGKK